MKVIISATMIQQQIAIETVHGDLVLADKAASGTLSDASPREDAAPTESARQALCQLVIGVFDAPELVRFMAGWSESDLHTKLPAPSVPFAEMVFQTVLLLEREGMIDEFLARLRREKPRSVGKIERISALLLGARP